MRVDNWPAKLYEVIEKNQQLPFEWGKTDCFCFAADCVLAITGYDFLEDYRGCYADQATAEGLIAEYGGVEDALDAVLAPIAAPKELLLATRGDVALIKMGEKLMCGIWVGTFALAPLPDRGLTEVPPALVKKIWGVP